MLERLSLRLRIFLFFAALALGGVAAIVAGLWFGYRKIADPALLNGFILAGSVASFAILGLVTWVWYLFDENVARAIGRISAGLRAQAHAEGAGALDLAPGRYLGDLAPAAGAVAENLTVTRSALAQAVERETRRLAEEKARLEALLSDVPVGVLLCSGRPRWCSTTVRPPVFWARMPRSGWTGRSFPTCARRRCATPMTGFWPRAIPTRCPI